MDLPVLRFCANLESSHDAQEHINYEPPSFPPPDDFYVSVAADGKPLSRYSDDRWDFSAYASIGLNFGNQKLTPENNDRLKQLMFLHLYHMPLFPGKIKSLAATFKILSKLCKFSDSQNICVAQLYRFPRLASAVLEFFNPPQHARLIGVLNRLLRAQNVLGWKIADAAFIEDLAQLQVPHIPTQNAYIPPRIWLSLIQSTELVMDSFEKHQAAFEDAWNWVYEAYRHNIENGFTQKSPFIDPDRNTCIKGRRKPTRVPRRTYPGGAKAFFEEYGLADLLNRWVGYIPNQHHDLHAFTQYANLVRDCAFTFILAHSIQRREEGLSLRSDCFVVDEDPTLGKVALLVGETTKTDPDSDARWVVPMSVKRSVKILSSLARLRVNTTFKPVPSEIQKNPYLMTAKIEHWGSGTSSIKATQWDLGFLVGGNPLVFDVQDFTISEEDYKIAYQLTPMLTEKPWFEIGKVWSFNAHQLRRTLAVNLFASGIEEPVIQWMMKHKSPYQSYYYGRNYTRLRTNSLAAQIVLIESYRTVVRNLVEVAENSLGDSVHATGKNFIALGTLQLIEQCDHKKLEALAKKGEIAARPTLLGFCMTESCEYGGVESAVHCAGVDGKGPCKDAVFSKKNSKRLKALYDKNEHELNDLVENTPRHSKLKAENEAIEVYFHATT